MYVMVVIKIDKSIKTIENTYKFQPSPNPVVIFSNYLQHHNMFAIHFDNFLWVKPEGKVKVTHEIITSVPLCHLLYQI